MADVVVSGDDSAQTQMTPVVVVAAQARPHQKAPYLPTEGFFGGLPVGRC